MPISRRQFLAQTSALLISQQFLRHKAIANALDETGLKSVFKDDFYLGMAMSGERFDADNADKRALIAQEFNSIVLENAMKWAEINPEPGEWDWSIADAFVDFGEKHHMYVCGHVLVWHSQVPDWVFKNAKGKRVRRKELYERMDARIESMVSRYEGRVHAWEVVNEAIGDNNRWRKSPWYRILGSKFIERAFNKAHEVDPKAHLYYNDYNMHDPGKREFLLRYLAKQAKRGTPIHGIGMQGHVGLDYPDIEEFENSIRAYARAGYRVHITEMEMDVLPQAWDYMGAEISKSFEYSDELNPYPNGLPADVENALTERYVAFFKLFLKYKDDIERVTLWGLADHESWKNNFPVRGRTNYPLLFDRNYQKKPVYYALESIKNS